MFVCQLKTAGLPTIHRENLPARRRQSSRSPVPCKGYHCAASRCHCQWPFAHSVLGCHWWQGPQMEMPLHVWALRQDVRMMANKGTGWQHCWQNWCQCDFLPLHGCHCSDRWCSGRAMTGPLGATTPDFAFFALSMACN